MAFFNRQDIGRVYMIKMILPDDSVIHKIGMTLEKTATPRLMAILESWFSYFRFVPYTELRMSLKCHNPQKLEKYIHKILKQNQFIPNFKVMGYTEMFIGLNESRVINFLKSYNNSPYIDPPEIDENQCKIICQLLTH